jgi:NAD(P)-dependent dehydrogenase (short-subunit alcohol dehydrogenase family)
MKKLFSVEGKDAVITGGSRGIGEMIASGFVESGVKTYITARGSDELNATAQRLSEKGECIAIPADLSTISGIEGFVLKLREYEDGVDIVVNNAGATWGEPIESFPENGWDKVMNLNLKSPFFLTQKLLPELKKAGKKGGSSSVINIASMHSFINPGLPTYSYSSSKAAMVHLTRHLAVDLAKDSIHVNAIAPGHFPSKMTSHITAEEVLEEIQTIPLGRLGVADDIAGTAIFLCSRAASWITGETIILDGGVVAKAG